MFPLKRLWFVALFVASLAIGAFLSETVDLGNDTGYSLGCIIGVLAWAAGPPLLATLRRRSRHSPDPPQASTVDYPNGEPLERFLPAFAAVASGVSRLLDMKFVPGSPDQSTFIGTALQSILQLNNEGKLAARDVQLNRMAMLAKHLKEVADANPSLFDDFRERLRAVANLDEFFGVRFELNIAATLCRHQISFHKTESPDFLIDSDQNQIGIECTSVRLRKPTDKQDFRYKLHSKLREKSQMPYASTSTALFVDITNVMYHTVQAGGNLNGLLNRTAAAHIAEASPFGNLGIFAYFTIPKEGGIHSSYIRLDKSTIAPPLRDFLNLCFPFGSLPVGAIFVPEEG